MPSDKKSKQLTRRQLLGSTIAATGALAAGGAVKQLSSRNNANSGNPKRIAKMGERSVAFFMASLETNEMVWP